MTWFRVEAGLPRHELVGTIAEALKVELSTALGFYVGTLAGFAEYQPDGLVKSVTSSTLEGWAGWRGKPGRYATFFRSRCVETRQGQRDEPGVVKGWWRNRKVLEEQERSRRRPGEGTRKATRGLLGANSVPSRGDVDVDVDVDGKSSFDRASRALISTIDPASYTIRCTAAANRGLRENPAINGRFNELVSSAQDEPGLWQAAGIPIDVAESAIYRRAKDYRPHGKRIQPTTLGYFRQTVDEEWGRVQGRAAEGSVNTSAPVVEDEIAELTRRAQALIDRRKERHRAAAT